MPAANAASALACARPVSDSRGSRRPRIRPCSLSEVCPCGEEQRNLAWSRDHAAILAEIALLVARLRTPTRLESAVEMTVRTEREQRASVKASGRGAALLLGVVAVAGCGSATSSSSAAAGQSGARLPAALVAGRRPIGHGARFQPPALGPVVGRCRPALGRRVGVHVELFAADRVVLVAAGIGTRPPRAVSAGRIARAGCYGDLVTLEPTGVVQVRAGANLRLADLFRSWGQPLSERRLATFATPAGTRVAVFVDGRPWRGSPGSVPLRAHAEIVLETGPYVPPHRTYTFPPGT